MLLRSLYRHRVAAAVIAAEPTYRNLSDAELRTKALALKFELKSGTNYKRLIVPAFALVREAARRVLGMQHFSVQLQAGVGLYVGGLAQMRTGEGKTITATLPVFLRALDGRGAHVLTTNDYLAERDAKTMGPVYELLGLTVGCVTSEAKPEARREAYMRDVTYATSREVGFDFLRDRLALGARGDENHQWQIGDEPPPGCVQRALYFALVDEADSVLLDDAVTPLIIAQEKKLSEARKELFEWADRVIFQLKANVDYLVNSKEKTAYLYDDGCRRLSLMAKPRSLSTFDSETLYKHVELALRAHFLQRLKIDYVVHNKRSEETGELVPEVQILDESTGRILDGRKWQDGLHQAVEKKEKVPFSAESGEAARVTVQTFYRRYEWLAGMTGTAIGAEREFKRVYRLSTSHIPTNKPCIRRVLPTKIYATMAAKHNALVSEIGRLVTIGRPVLVGTPSVKASLALSERLHAASIKHTLLNALNDSEEAQIIANAGAAGVVTLATNMAGRGTDIHLSPEAVKAGGLHVIATELHSSRRIDDQLVGRAARQGDPGSAQFWLSLDDELLSAVPANRRAAWQARAGQHNPRPLSVAWLRIFRREQRRLEALQQRQRRLSLRREHERHKTCERMGIDPFLELPD
jgi:preprotein translocase subunit SecA